MSLLCFKEDNSHQKEQNRKISNGLNFPIYIVTSSFQSPHLNSLQKLLQKQKITIAFQKQTDSLLKIAKTYQNKFFIVLNDFSERPQLNGQFANLNYQTLQYPQAQGRQLVRRYRSFVDRQLKYHQQTQNELQKNEKRQNHDKEKEQNWSSEKESKIKLKSISKILHTYKTSWPKRLFIYSNKHDDQKYCKYLLKIRQMNFPEAVYIDQIEEYVKQTSEEKDIANCVLMSEYSAINLRKFFKKTDQILLLGCNREQCLPLLKGKVTFFTSQTQCMDSVMRQRFRMKAKQSFIENWKKIEDKEDCIKQEFLFSTTPNYKSTLQRSDSKFSEGKSGSGTNLKIIPQFSLLNQETTKQTHLRQHPNKQLMFQSKIIDLNVGKRQTQSISQKHSKNQPQFQSHPDHFQEQLQQEMFGSIENISPLKVAQQEAVYIVSNSNHSSEFSERQVFEDIFRKINFEEPNLAVQNEQMEQSQHSADSVRPSELKPFSKQNSSKINQEQSQSSRFSNRSSRNSRIMNRVRKGGDTKYKLHIDKHQLCPQI